ncbi:MAG TPA: hypothetical protein VG052_06320 [Puia sp.]|nr:hypothetical protein [Puia sp.]
MLTPARRIYVLLLSQLLLCLLETYLISKISLIGKIGIATVHHEYALLRSFWKTYGLLSLLQVALIITLYILGKRSSKKITNLVSTVLLVVGLLGLLVTFQDFLQTYTHRLLKERFHLGFYIFWLSWMSSCLFFLFSGKTMPLPTSDPTRIPFPVGDTALNPVEDPSPFPAKDASPFPSDPDAPPTNAHPSPNQPPPPYTHAVKE